MKKHRSLKAILSGVQNGKIGIEEALTKLKHFPFDELTHTKLDTHRELRKGFPEVIFCQGKTVGQIVEIARAIKKHGDRLLMTRASEEVYSAVKALLPGARMNTLARTIAYAKHPVVYASRPVAIVTAGTGDIPVAEEARETLAIIGRTTEQFYDVGVAGIHRLLLHTQELDSCAVAIVVAGMDGVLPSVVGGIVSHPVIAVPTSVGYGAHFSGLAPLLTMLNSCAPGVAVVNIDNGFGAGYFASMINI
ncbi:MAG: nickel pincer cofactor biosynthesis protein LarB [Candidatus Omnitrophica bacterium]|nr:nickel pincer cofactor biosynthesis protein LarB [Candidatus Omnitrophota bacterium]